MCIDYVTCIATPDMDQLGNPNVCYFLRRATKFILWFYGQLEVHLLVSPQQYRGGAVLCALIM